MQVIWGPGQASNILYTAQKRLIRPAYSNTLAHPYAGTLDAALRNTDGSINVNPKDCAGGTRASEYVVYTYSGSIVPGTVMVKTTAEAFTVASGDQVANEVPFGLLGQWVGGTFDNLGQNNQIGVWQGFDSVYELLAPAWDDTNLAVAVTTANTNGVPVLLRAGSDGRLTLSTNDDAGGVNVARVLDRPTASRLLIQLLI